MATTQEFVDTHVHFWDRPHPTLEWSWLADDAIHPTLGKLEELKAIKRYLGADLRSDAERSNVRKVVHVQAAIGTPDPVEETRWLQAMADETGWPNGIIADARLQSDDIADLLERHCEFPNMRGIRDFAEGDYLVDPRFHHGYGLLERFGLTYELETTWEHMGKAADLARKFPGVPLVLQHAGLPLERNQQYFESWRAGLEEFSGLDNVVMKVSGLGMGDHADGATWTIDSIRPYVLGCIEAFGIDRTFFGTNWPVDRLWSTYEDLIDAYDSIISEFSDSERDALFRTNAERWYRI